MQIMSVTISKLQYLRLCGTRECAWAAAVTCAACCLGLSQPKGGRADWKQACHRCFSLLARLLFVSSNFGWMSYNKVVFIIFSNDDTMAWQSVIFVEEGKFWNEKPRLLCQYFTFWIKEAVEAKSGDCLELKHTLIFLTLGVTVSTSHCCRYVAGRSIDKNAKKKSFASALNWGDANLQFISLSDEKKATFASVLTAVICCSAFDIQT